MEKISSFLENFLNYSDKLKKEHDYCSKNMENCNKATQDFLHQLELGDYNSRRKVTTKLANTRKARRQFKDYVETSDPFFLWMTSQEGISTINKLKKILGDIRKQEKNKSFRHYNPKIIKDLDFITQREEKNND